MLKQPVALLAAIGFAIASFAQNSAVVYGDRPGDTINRNIYGHFAEHLGHCIYDGFYVGDSNKTIPNTAGVRNDIIAALRELHIPNLRWPGGCFADTYHWKDGIGPKATRAKMVNIWWGGVTEDNSFGTREFLNLCESLGAEPYVTGNVGSGTVQELAQWIQYVNSDGENPMSKLRRENGRDKPWRVQYWGIGNEAWGCGGNMTPEYYADEFRKYATFLTNWTQGGRLVRIASGANSDDYRWTETLMSRIPGYLLGGLALHHYAIIDWSRKSSATDFTEKQYAATLASALKMDTLVTRHAAIMDKYDPQKKVALVVDEWGGWYDVEPGTNPGFLYQQNTMRDAVLAGATLNIFNNHCDRVRMANLAQTINVLQAVILTDKEKMILTPTYHVLNMYKVHQDAVLLPVSLTTGRYVQDGLSLPAVSASASRDAQGRVHISLVNIDAGKAQPVSLDLRGVDGRAATATVLTSARLQDHNSFDDPNRVTPKAFRNFTWKQGRLDVVLPPFSVVVLEIGK